MKRKNGFKQKDVQKIKLRLRMETSSQSSSEVQSSTKRRQKVTTKSVDKHQPVNLDNEIPKMRKKAGSKEEEKQGKKICEI